MVDYVRAVKKPFTDITKLIVGVLLSMIPVVNWIAKGFILENSGLGKSKPSNKMPEWKNWGNLFVKGFLSTIITLIYALPALILLIYVISTALLSVLSISSIMGIVPSDFFENLLVLLGQSPEVIMQSFEHYLPLFMPTLIALTPALLIVFALALLALYVSPIAILTYIKTKKISSAFNLGLVFKKAFTLRYFILWIVTTIITGAITSVLVLIPFIGNATSYFIAGIIAFDLYGQIYNKI